jgi:hypothetical protein
VRYSILKNSWYQHIIKTSNEAQKKPEQLKASTNFKPYTCE